MSLAWLPPEEEGGSVVTGYFIEMQKVDQVEWTLCNTTPIKMCEYTLTHMPQGAEYKFRVIACNAGGSGEPAEIPGVVKVQEMLGITVFHCLKFVVLSFITYMDPNSQVCVFRLP